MSSHKSEHYQKINQKKLDIYKNVNCNNAYSL